LLDLECRWWRSPDMELEVVEMVEVTGFGGAGGGGCRIWRWRLMGAAPPLVKERGVASEGRGAPPPEGSRCATTVAGPCVPLPGGG
jgi:hypothetical protein